MEDFSRINEEVFDVITARAVSNLSVLSEISVRALKVGGKLVFMKANCDEELENISSIYNKLGLKLNSVNKFVLPIEQSNRTLVCIEKTKSTDKKYPRTIDKIKRNPL